MTAIRVTSENVADGVLKAASVGIGLAKLTKAFAQVRADAKDDFLPDLIGYRDYSTNLNERLAMLLQDVRTYQPSSLLSFEVPKSPYSSRPGSYLQIDDRIVYQALVGGIASLLDNHLEPRDVVFGFRVAKNPRSRLIEHNVNRWLDMRKTLRSKRSEFSYLVQTDLVGYFEHIDHRMLKTDLESLGVKKPITDLLARLLAPWQTSPGHGLPQNTEPSSILANFYLNPIDKAMIRAGFRYFRFMDDMYVLSNSKLETKRALQLLTKACRERRLFLNSRKTEVIEGAHIDEFLLEDNDHRLNIDYLIAVENIAQAESLLHNQIGKLGRKGNIDERELRFLLNRLRRTKDPVLVKRSLGLFEDYPHLSDQISQYLSVFVSQRPTIQSRIFSFLSSDANIYPWQEMWLLRCLFGCKTIDRKYLNWLLSRTESNQPWFNRSLCVMLLGRFGDESDRNHCWGMLGASSEINRAVLLSCQGIQKSMRLQRCNEAMKMNPQLTYTARFVKEQAFATWPT